MKKFSFLVMLFAFVLTSFIYLDKKQVKEYVPDENTAKKIAEAIWFPIYGESVLNQKPYKAELKGNVWIVTGTLSDSIDGGVAYIEIQKSDCKVLKVTHGK